MNNSFQRIGAKSNSQVGRDFENTALNFFRSQNLILTRNIKIDIGIEDIHKQHAFDLGSKEQKIIVECKSHKWTSSANVPSAKMTVWNEAMYYFVASPNNFRKIMFVLYDYSEKRKETLAQYYLRTYRHLVPKDVEFWEYKEGVGAEFYTLTNHSSRPLTRLLNSSVICKENKVLKVSSKNEVIARNQYG